MLEQMGGLQAQYAPSMYIGLWSRLDGFERAALTRALEAREVIQGTLMRSTIHLVSAADYWPLAVAVRGAARLVGTGDARGSAPRRWRPRPSGCARRSPAARRCGARRSTH